MSISLATYADPRSASAEAYRMLRTNLQFSSPDEPLKSVVVSSATPGEGKTTTACNLAVTFAQAGKKTLLVDGDLRKPTVHKFFGLANDSGLSSMIVHNQGEVAELSSVENLYVITSGPIPPNPAELFSSNKARDLFASLEEQYDIIIVDTPPIAAVSDAMVLSTYASGTLLIIDHGVVTNDLAQKVVAQLRGVKINILGVVLNKVPMNGQDYYYYQYQR